VTAHFVLVHGGTHTSRCWAPVLPHLSGPALAVDLPGRGSSTAELSGVTIENCVESLVTALRATESDRIVLVGHSLAGVTIPLAAARLPDRVRHVVFISCTIPPPGSSCFDTLPRFLRPVMHRWARRSDGRLDLPRPLGRLMLCNGLDAGQRALVLDHLCPEAWSLMANPVPAYDLPAEVGRTYVVLRRDHAFPVWYQRRQARTLNCATVDLDASHEAFVARPQALAAILNGIADEPGR
jgi:pimeloyl-ACP methyl ester carboxylesterase